jgi:uncharacterized protein (TIGR02145 family)
MKNAINFSRVIMVVIIGFTLATCQKDEEMVLNSQNETDIESPRLKTVVYYEYIGYHLNYFTYNSINRMLNEGILNKGNANALIVKCKAAMENLWKGKYETAIGILNAFIDLAEDLVAEGKILEEQGNELVQVPAAIIANFSYQCGDPVNDLRDGKVYETVQIGDQCWLARNLDFRIKSAEGYPLYTYYDDNDAYGPKYGALYNLSSLGVAIFSVCPVGWRIPSDEDWKTLEGFLGMNEYDLNKMTGYRDSGDVGNKLKSNEDWDGNNSSGFNALPGGYSSGNFQYMGSQAGFWTTTNYVNHKLFRMLYSDYTTVTRYADSRLHLSIRCIRNEL